MAFGPALARLRRSRGLSQEALADAAGLSQRHVSFLETGRARPGQRSLAALIAALALRGWEQRTLVDALAPQPPAGTETPDAPDPALVTLLAERLSPWPAYAFRPDGTLLAANRALGRLLETAAPGENLWAATAPAGGPNIYDLVFHPAGLGRWLENPEAVIPETLRRLRIEAAQDRSLTPVLRRIERYPAVQSLAARAQLSAPPVLVERYHLREAVLSVISVISHLASPGEYELDGLRLETFLPADAASERLLAGLSG